METIDNFKAIKQEILDRAHAHHACSKQYGRAYASETLQELCNVIKDNFDWCCDNNVLTTGLIEQYQTDFAVNRIYADTDVAEGYLLANDNATVRVFYNTKVIAFGNARVVACHNARVKVYSNATVAAYNNVKVRAYNNAKVRAYNNVMVDANDNANVVAYGHAKVEAYRNTKVQAYNYVMVKAYDNATVRAYDKTYCVSYRAINCHLSGNALYRVISTNTVYFANDNIKFQKQ